MKGIIMSGGKGTRIRPLTCDLPKPMVPIFNKPVMEYGINLLKKYGIDDIGLTLFYLPGKIVDNYGDGSRLDANIKYFVEDKPLGTGGSVKNAEEFLDDTVIVLSGDAFTDIDLKKAYDFHQEKGSKATLILKREPIPLEYGIVVTDDNGRIIRFLEKPSWGEVFSDTINTGIYILEPEIFEYYEKGENFDFSKDLFPRLLKDNVPMYGYVAEEYWSDVGNLDSYMQTHFDVLVDDKMHYLLGKEQEEGIWVGDGTIIENGAKIYPPVYIGSNSLIKEGATIEPYTVIGNNTNIGKGTSIKRSIIWDNVNITNDCEIRKSVICNNVFIGDRSRVFEGVVIGAYSRIFNDSTINPNVKIWPYKIIDENVEVNNNLIWEESISRKIFGDRNVSGVFNESMTPEISVGLGIAFASTTNENGTYFISSDEHNSTKAIQNAITSGVLATGSHVISIKNSTISICRFGVNYFNADGGIHIRGDINEDKIYIEFMDKEGANIDKNKSEKVENCLAIEDFHRCAGSEVENVVNIYDFAALYLKYGKKELKNIDKIRTQKPKLIIASQSKNVGNLAEEYLENIGCEVEIIKYRRNLKIEDIQNLVSKNGVDLGFLYSDNGEKTEITDGFNVFKDEEYFLFSLLIGLKSGDLKNVVVPYNYPRVMEKLVEKYKGNVIYSKSDISSIIQMIMNRETYSQYILNFDSIWATGLIVDYLVENDTTLEELEGELPKLIYLKKEIPCKWSDKGNIMKRLTENKKDSTELKEGVRFIDDKKGWALIIPDEEKPIFNIYIEGYTDEYAEELWLEYEKKIKDIMKDP